MFIPRPAAAAPRRLGDGWLTLLTASVARLYLVLLAASATLALAPALFGWSGSVVQSGSMEPKISAGDVVFTSELSSSSPLPVGRVVTFHVDGRLVIHRIVAVSDDNTLVTAGDANPHLDPWSIREPDITGQARLLIPYVGLPSLWLTRGDHLAFGIWAALTVGALIVVALTDADGRARRTGAPGGSSTRARRSAKLSGAVAGVAVLVLVAAPMSHDQAEAAFSARTGTKLAISAKAYSPITTGAMAGYGILAYTSVTDNSASTDNSSVLGAIGTSPGRSVVNYSYQDVSGGFHLNDQSAINAMSAATAARTALNQREVTATLASALSGTVTRGTYVSTTGFSVAGTVFLDAKNDPSARFVFRSATTLTMAQGARIVLVNGARAENVWWIVGTTATLGGTTTTGSTTIAVGNYLVNGAAVIRTAFVSGRIVSITSTVTSANADVIAPN
jgi:signal peptidase I